MNHWKEKAGQSVHRAMTYLKDYRFNSILIRYFLLLLAFLVVPVSLLNTLYGSRLQRNIKQEILQMNRSSLERNYHSIQSTMIAMKKMTYSIASRDNLRYLATLGNQLGQDQTGKLFGLQETMASMQRSYDYVDSIYVYLEQPNAVISLQGIAAADAFSDNSWLQYYSPHMPQQPVIQTRCKINRFPYLITMMYPIYASTNDCLGVVVLNIDVERLGKYFGTGRYRNTTNAPVLLIFDESMQTLVYTDEFRLLHDEPQGLEELQQFTDRAPQFSEECTLWGDRYAVAGIASEQDGLRYLYLSPMNSFELQDNETAWMLRQITLVSVALCLVLAVLLAIWVYRPIQHIMELTDRTSRLTAWDKKERVDEIKAIQRSILATQSENKHLNEEIEERMLSLHNAQICALQTQINPHFLYNTLESIGNAAALATEEDNAVTEMIFTLGKLMRLSLSSANYLVPLAEELEHVRLYVKIMDFRYNGSIHVHLLIPDAILQERIVKLTMQPLIENAIEHGLTQNHCRGDIWLKCNKRNDEFFIYVVDNGAGLSEEELLRLREKINTPVLPDTRHIGLRNVNQRLKLVFGDRFGLNVSHASEGGLCVTIHFPAVSDEKTDKNNGNKGGKGAKDGIIVPKDGAGVG